MKGISKTLQDLYAQKKEITKQIATTRRQYRDGFKMGKRYCEAGMDIGSRSARWMSKSDAWREGYKDGWQEFLNN
jgi:hypothetical protein